MMSKAQCKRLGPATPSNSVTVSVISVTLPSRGDNRMRSSGDEKDPNILLHTGSPTLIQPCSKWLGQNSILDMKFSLSDTTHNLEMFHQQQARWRRKRK